MRAFTLILGLVASTAAAQTRPSTLTMSCRAANALVQSQGAIVLYTDRDHFDRYVAGQSQCGPGELATRALTRAADNPSCFIGYVCSKKSNDMR